MADVKLQHHEITIDGVPRLIIAGEVHYFRLAIDDWESRLQLLREAGANTVATYVPWVVHERGDGFIDATGARVPNLDLGRFIDLAGALGLFVLLRPGPFQMAELANEGIPNRVRAEHPEILPITWEGKLAPTGDIDYLAPAFLQEVQRWYAALGPVVAPRMASAGGPVIGIQLDNEVGMLAWVANAPQLTLRACAAFQQWLATEYGPQLSSRYPALPNSASEFAGAIQNPKSQWARSLRLDLGRFARAQFATYIATLANLANSVGIGGVPFYINVHGTDAGGGASFPIGISQLFKSYSDIPGFAGGSDHYLGEFTLGKAVDLHMINAFLAAVNGPDQPLTSLEFEAGNGDYGDDLFNDVSPEAVVLKTHLSLAQGNRLINYYLFAGGTNYVADPPRTDGTTRFGITGERHGFAAPVTPEGARGVAFDSTAAAMHLAAELEPRLVNSVETHDEVALGLVLDNYLTEYRPATEPGDAVGDLAYARGLGPRGIIGKVMHTLGFRYGAVDLQNPKTTMPHLVVLGSPGAMDRFVQERLAAHLFSGGALLLVGEVPTVALDGTPCTIVADYLGIGTPTTMHDGHGNFLSVIPAWGRGTERRIGRAQLLPRAENYYQGKYQPILREALSGLPCGILSKPKTGGRAIVIGCDFGYDEQFWRRVFSELGATPGLARIATPGLLTLTTTSPAGDLLHIINASSRPVTTTYALAGVPLFDGEAITTPAHTSVALPI